MSDVVALGSAEDELKQYHDELGGGGAKRVPALVLLHDCGNINFPMDVVRCVLEVCYETWDDPRYNTQNGRDTPLTRAIRRRDVEEVKTLLSQGASPNKRLIPYQKPNEEEKEEDEEEDEEEEDGFMGEEGDAPPSIPLTIALASRNLEIVDLLCLHPAFRLQSPLELNKYVFLDFPDAGTLHLLQYFPFLSGLSVTAALRRLWYPKEEEPEWKGEEDPDEEEEPKWLPPEEFKKQCGRTYGVTNPEPRGAGNTFVQEMMKGMWSAYKARSVHETPALMEDDSDTPVWCFHRFGTSITRISEGRYVLIGGEHEDSYDPDFMIYNDVVVFDMKPTGGLSGYQMYAYPVADFPPTDFHTATLLPGEDAVLIIGNVGYSSQRVAGSTPVYRLGLQTMAIHAVPTSGACPGWIGRHVAWLDVSRKCIVLEGGDVYNAGMNENTSTFLLHLPSNVWTEDMKDKVEA